MVEHCPVVKTMRALRKEYRIGIEFTDWPTRPKVRVKARARARARARVRVHRLAHTPQGQS